MGISIPPKYAVGFCYINKQGLPLKVVKYEGRKKVTVRFDLDGEEKVTTGSYIAKHLPIHSSFGKNRVGNHFPCKDGDIVEVIKLYSQSRCRVKWLSDGTEWDKDLSDLKKGVNKHPTKNVPCAGDKFESNSSGTVTVVKYNSATDILVEWPDGEVSSVPFARLSSGNIRHPFCNLSIGSKYRTNSGWDMEIVEYKDTHNVLVKWQDGSSTWESASSIRAGTIKPLMQPSVAEVGYFGIGRFVPFSYDRGEKVDSKINGYWTRMIVRCYDQKTLAKPSGRAYKDVRVCDEWHNFQNFAEWAITQPYVFEEDASLDKDLLSSGNKVYSPEVCCFLPSDTNIFLSEKRTGSYPRGVHIIEPKEAHYKTGYIARVCNGVDREYLGFYNTPEEAFAAYKPRKEQLAREHASRLKGKISPRAYEALMNYEVLITD